MLIRCLSCGAVLKNFYQGERLITNINRGVEGFEITSRRRVDLILLRQAELDDSKKKSIFEMVSTYELFNFL